MVNKVFELQIYQQAELIYYTDLHIEDPNYEIIRNQHRIQLCYGVSESTLAFIKKIHPDKKTQMKSFRTKEYQYNLLDTINGVRFILLTSLLPEKQVDVAMKNLYDAYINYVKRNYMYKHGNIIRISKFNVEVHKILEDLKQAS